MIRPCIIIIQRAFSGVNLWADAVNESISFTARNASAQPAELTWLSDNAQVSKTGQNRFVKYIAP